MVEWCRHMAKVEGSSPLVETKFGGTLFAGYRRDRLMVSRLSRGRTMQVRLLLSAHNNLRETS